MSAPGRLRPARTVLARRRREPLFDVTLFRYASFRWGRHRGYAAVPRPVCGELHRDVVPADFRGHLKALQAGLVSAPFALFGTIAAPLGGWLANRTRRAADRAGGSTPARGRPSLALVDCRTGPGPPGSLPVRFRCSASGQGSPVRSSTPPRSRISLAIGRETPRAPRSRSDNSVRRLPQPLARADPRVLGHALWPLEGYDRSARGVGAMENVVLAMMVINFVCLVLTLLIPNHVPPRSANPIRSTRGTRR